MPEIWCYHDQDEPDRRSRDDDGWKGHGLIHNAAGERIAWSLLAAAPVIGFTASKGGLSGERHEDDRGHLTMWDALLLLIGLIVAACASVLALPILLADGKIILRLRTLFVSILAAMAYDWFFVPPIYSLAIEDPLDWLGVDHVSSR